MPQTLMASQPDQRCRYYVRLADVPPRVRLHAAVEATRTWPGEGAELMAAALYPDPEHGEWVAEPLEDLLGRVAA